MDDQEYFVYFLFIGVILMIISVISWALYGRLRFFFFVLFIMGLLVFTISYLAEYQLLQCHGRQLKIPYEELLF